MAGPCLRTWCSEQGRGFKSFLPALSRALDPIHPFLGLISTYSPVHHYKHGKERTCFCLSSVAGTFLHSAGYIPCIWVFFTGVELKKRAELFPWPCRKCPPYQLSSNPEAALRPSISAQPMLKGGDRAGQQREREANSFFPSTSGQKFTASRSPI